MGRFGRLPEELFRAALPAAAKVVYAALSMHADRECQAWPTVRTLAELAQVSERQARRHLAELERAGWIRRDEGPRATRYTVPRTPDTSVTPNGPRPRTPVSRVPRTPMTATPDTSVPPSEGVPRTPMTATPDISRHHIDLGTDQEQIKQLSGLRSGVRRPDADEHEHEEVREEGCQERETVPLSALERERPSELAPTPGLAREAVPSAPPTPPVAAPPPSPPAVEAGAGDGGAAAAAAKPKRGGRPPSDEALRLADWLRRHMLEAKPDHAIGRGATSEAKWGASPKRAAWGRELDRMHKLDGRDWRRSAELVRWVFRGQTGEARFVVESAASLREKWDRLDGAARPARGANGTRRHGGSNGVLEYRPGERSAEGRRQL